MPTRTRRGPASRSTTAASAVGHPHAARGLGRKPGLVAGHEFTGTIAALGEGVDGLGHRRQRWSRARRRKCGRCRRCLEGKPSQCENRQGSVVDGHDGAFARYVLVTGGVPAALPPGARGTPGGPGRAAGRGPPRHHPVGRGTGRQRDGHRSRAHRGALRRRAGGARASDRSPSSSPGNGAGSWPSDLGAAEVLDPTELETFPRGSPSGSPRAVARGARVLGQEGGHGGGLPPAAPGGTHGPGRGGHRGARRSTPTGSSSTSSTWWARSSTTRAGSSGPSSCWPRTTSPPTC